MFNHSFHNSPKSDTILQDLKNLLTEKYLNVIVKNVSKDSNNQIKVILLNGQQGDGIDKENKRPIQYLESFGALSYLETFGQENGEVKVEHPYWCHSVITFSESKLNDIINGLQEMLIPNPGNNIGKIMAAC